MRVSLYVVSAISVARLVKTGEILTFLTKFNFDLLVYLANFDPNLATPQPYRG